MLSEDLLGIKDCVCGVQSGLILCGITNQSLLLSEGNEGWGNSVTLLIGNCFPWSADVKMIALKPDGMSRGEMDILISTPFPS